LGTFSEIVCFKCKQKGHKSYECPNGKFTGICNNCGMVGHMYANCWEREENKGKRPANYKPKETQGEQTNMNIDGGSEFVLCGFDSTREKMMDSNVSATETVEAEMTFENEHHLNCKAEKKIRDLQELAHTMLLNAKQKWPNAVTSNLWPYAMRMAKKRMTKMDSNVWIVDSGATAHITQKSEMESPMEHDIESDTAGESETPNEEHDIESDTAGESDTAPNESSGESGSSTEVDEVGNETNSIMMELD
jgi:hypothetical protein